MQIKLVVVVPLYIAVCQAAQSFFLFFFFGNLLSFCFMLFIVKLSLLFPSAVRGLDLRVPKKSDDSFSQSECLRLSLISPKNCSSSPVP